MVLQVLFRIVTFAMNAVVLRYVSKATLGIANVRLMLLYTTALLFSREAIRKATLDLRPRFVYSQLPNMHMSYIRWAVRVCWFVHGSYACASRVDNAHAIGTTKESTRSMLCSVAIFLGALCQLG